MIGLSSAVLLIASVTYAVHTPECTHPGLGSFAFARRYLRNHFCFLFLRLLRCFSSPGSLCTPMDSVHSDQGLLGRVSPFRYLRIDVYLPLPAAFRSLSRLSSALSAKASTLRSSSLYQQLSSLCFSLMTFEHIALCSFSCFFVTLFGITLVLGCLYHLGFL